MTKALVCIACVDLRMLRSEGPVTCQCGNVTGEWIDARAGTCRIVATDLTRAALMGINNSFFLPGLRSFLDGENTGDRWWKLLHDLSVNAQGYYFDKQRRDCWAILMNPDDPVSGVTWERRQEP